MKCKCEKYPLKEFKIINLHSNDTNKIRYSNYIDIDIDHTSEEFEEIYIGEMIELFNITPEKMNTLYYDITTSYIHDHTNSEK
jgi:hypothetical protein